MKLAEHETTFRVDFADTDGAGVVFYPNYLRYFDRATHELFRSIGYPTDELFAKGIAVAVVEANVRYRASLVFGDQVTVSTRVAELRTRAFRLEHTVMRGGELVCQGYEVRVWVRVNNPTGTVSPQPLPEAVRSALQVGVEGRESGGEAR